jgi:molybdopterin converting factor small subunit
MDARGSTIGECLDDIIRQYPQSKTWLLDQDSLLRVMISVNNLEIITQGTESLHRILEPGDEIIIFAVASGG